MSKGLEALHTIAFNTQINGMNFGNDLRIIEKELKVLDIIKEKNVDIFFLRNSCDTVEEYNKEINDNNMYYCYGNCRELTQQEFELLKEVLK